MALVLKHAAIAAVLCSAGFVATAAAQDVMQGTNRVEEAISGPPAQYENRAPEASITDPVARPRFKVQFVNFHANDETGVDALGADEIFVVIETDQYHMATRAIGGVDTDETVRLSPRFNCIWPAVDPDRRFNRQWRCANEGASGRINFSITLYETDGQTPFSSGACLAPGANSDLLPHNEPVFCSAESNQSVFSHRREFTEAALATMIPAVNQHQDFTIDGDAYFVTYRVTRMPDAIVQQDRVLER